LFTYAFTIERIRIQIAMTAMVAVVISLNLYLVLMFGHPYSGDLRIDPEGFRITRSITQDRAGLLSTPIGSWKNEAQSMSIGKRDLK
jgi:hypothetical protein